MLLSVYGHPVKNISTARVVSSKEAKRLFEEQKKEDAIRVKYGLPPLIKEGYNAT